jgi:hypothetical protein
MTNASTVPAYISMYVSPCNGYAGRPMVQLCLCLIYTISIYDQYWHCPGVSFN